MNNKNLGTAGNIQAGNQSQQAGQVIAANQNTISGGLTSGLGYGYSSTLPYTYHGQGLTSPSNSDLIVIRKVENGSVLTMNGKEYIITDNKQVLKYLELVSKKVKQI